MCVLLCSGIYCVGDWATVIKVFYLIIVECVPKRGNIIDGSKLILF